MLLAVELLGEVLLLASVEALRDASVVDVLGKDDAVSEELEVVLELGLVLLLELGLVLLP